MRRLHTTWNHPAKLQSLLLFGVYCIFFFCFGSLLVFDPALAKLWWVDCTLVGLALVVGFYGYRALFFSEEWFQAREAWWQEHRRLRLVKKMAGWLLCAVVVAREIAKFLRHLN